MNTNGQADAATPSELSVMLDLYSEEADRNAIRKAYFGLAHGDPSTFAVQFAVLLTAHAQALKLYGRPCKIKITLWVKYHKIEVMIGKSRSLNEL